MWNIITALTVFVGLIGLIVMIAAAVLLIVMDFDVLLIDRKEK